eukprot:1160378-Pelagomonas_calceolata.AAC.1
MFLSCVVTRRCHVVLSHRAGQRGWPRQPLTPGVSYETHVHGHEQTSMQYTRGSWLKSVSDSETEQGNPLESTWQRGLSEARKQFFWSALSICLPQPALFKLKFLFHWGLNAGSWGTRA